MMIGIFYFIFCLIRRILLFPAAEKVNKKAAAEDKKLKINSVSLKSFKPAFAGRQAHPASGIQTEKIFTLHSIYFFNAFSLRRLTHVQHST